MMRTTFIAILLASLVATACTTRPATGAGAGARGADGGDGIAPLAGTSWKVAAYDNGKGEMVDVLPGSRVSARFESNGQVTGSAGCNRYFASYRQQEQRLSVGMGATTRKFCAEPPGLMRQESLYMSALQSSTALAIAGDRLELRAADGAPTVILQRGSGE